MSTDDRPTTGGSIGSADTAETTRDGRALSRQEVRELRARQLRRALTLTGLSTVWPGAGLLGTKRRWWGIALGLIAAASILVLLLLLLNGGLIHGAARFATRRGLLSLLLLFVVGGLAWIAGIVLTARETSGRRWSPRMRWIHRAFTAIMVLIIAIPAAQATRYVIVTQQAFNKIFTQRYDARGGSVATPGGGSNPWKDVPRVNILLLGSDAGKGRTNVRTDSMMLVSVNTKTGDSTLISVPRNFQRAPIPASNPLHKIYPNGYYCPEQSTPCMMETLWVEADVLHRDLFPKDEASPGQDTVREVIGEITGLHIDYTAVIDLAGFRQLVDAMGGVWINVPGPDPGIPIGGVIRDGYVVPGSITGYIKPGYQKLNGQLALWYSRSRVSTSDDDRMRRQRCMVNALIDQTDPVKMISKFTNVMNVAANNIRIDIPQDNLPAFATLVDTMKKGNLITADIGNATSHVNPDYAKIRSIVQTAINKPHNPTSPKPGSTAPTSSAPGSSTTNPSTTTSSPTSTDPISDTAASC